MTEAIIVTQSDIKPKRSIIYNIIKYTVAVLPIIVPFGITMYIVNNILAAILVTFIFDFTILLTFVAHTIRTSKMGNVEDWRPPT